MSIVVKKCITLEMAHRLPNHKGKCHNLHGHSWVLELAVEGPVKPSDGQSDEGMVIDFTALKTALKYIEEIFDHSLVLASHDFLTRSIDHSFGTTPVPTHFAWGTVKSTSIGRLVIVPFAPTSENLAVLWGKIIRSLLEDSGVNIVTVSVKETCTSEAIWTPTETL